MSFGDVVRVDDDTDGLNQRIVSIAVDERSQELFATWEDRRGGANVHFSLSEDLGQRCATNIDFGAGLGGDQFRPRRLRRLGGGPRRGRRHLLRARRISRGDSFFARAE